MQLIERDTIITNAELIIEAARAFRQTATFLCEALAIEKNVSPSELIIHCSGVGHLSDEWSYGFHGWQCGFKNEKTHQVVEVEISFGSEFGVLDPQFFGEFVTTTSQFKPLGKLCSDLFYDYLGILVVMEELGHFVEITAVPPYRKVGVVVRTDA